MNESEFWDIIDKSKKAANELEDQYKQLKEILKKYEPEDIISFDLIWHKKHIELYRWDLWAIAYIINGGCGDDSFIDFRSWIISRGKEFYNNASDHPKYIGENVKLDEESFFEEIAYAADEAYEEKTGEEMSVLLDRYPKEPDDPYGEYWDEDDLENLYPELCKKFKW